MQQSYILDTSSLSHGEKQAGTTCELALYNTDTLKPVRRFLFEDGAFSTIHANGHRASLNPRRLAFSPDGKHLLIGCDGVLLIDAQNGKIVRQFDIK